MGITIFAKASITWRKSHKHLAILPGKWGRIASRSIKYD